MSKFTNELRNLVASNRLDEMIRRLMESLAECESVVGKGNLAVKEIRNKVIQYSARLNNIKSREAKQIISHDEAEISLGRILNSLLELIDDFPKYPVYLNYLENAEEDEAWNEAKRRNEIGAYQHFFEKYPDGKYKNETRKVIAELKEIDRKSHADIQQKAQEEKDRREREEAEERQRQKAARLAAETESKRLDAAQIKEAEAAREALEAERLRLDAERKEVERLRIASEQEEAERLRLAAERKEAERKRDEATHQKNKADKARAAQRQKAKEKALQKAELEAKMKADKENFRQPLAAVGAVKTANNRDDGSWSKLRNWVTKKTPKILVAFLVSALLTVLLMSKILSDFNSRNGEDELAVYSFFATGFVFCLSSILVLMGRATGTVVKVAGFLGAASLPFFILMLNVFDANEAFVVSIVYVVIAVLVIGLALRSVSRLSQVE